MLDDGHIGSGETGRTTAMLNNVPDDHLFSIRSMYGTGAAKLAYESMNAALLRMKEIADKEGFDCDWEWIDALLIVGCDKSHPDYAKEVDTLHKELDACHEAGFSGVRLAADAQGEACPASTPASAWCTRSRRSTTSSSTSTGWPTP